MRHLLFVFAALAVLLMGCSSVTKKPQPVEHKQAPAAKLVSFTYRHWGTMAEPNHDYELRLADDSTTAVLMSRGMASPVRDTITVPRAVLDSVAAIALRHNMQDYEKDYQPPFDVMDGWMWSLSLTYDNRDYISSRGTNARPHDNGIAEITAFLDSLLVK